MFADDARRMLESPQKVILSRTKTILNKPFLLNMLDQAIKYRLNEDFAKLVAENTDKQIIDATLLHHVRLPNDVCWLEVEGLGLLCTMDVNQEIRFIVFEKHECGAMTTGFPCTIQLTTPINIIFPEYPGITTEQQKQEHDVYLTLGALLSHTLLLMHSSNHVEINDLVMPPKLQVSCQERGRKPLYDHKVVRLLSSN